MTRRMLIMACGLGLAGPPALAQDGLLMPGEEELTPSTQVYELPERATRPVPDGHPVLAQFGDLLERLAKKGNPGRPEELLERMAGTRAFVTDLAVTPDAHARVIEGIAECEVVLGGRALRVSMEGEVRAGPVRMEYASEGILAHESETGEYVYVQRDVFATGVIELRGRMSVDETQLILSAPGDAGEILQVFRFGERGLRDIRAYLKPTGTDAYTFRGLTWFAELPDEPDQPEFLVVFTGTWEGDGASLPEAHRVVYGRHLAHLRELANSGTLVWSGRMGTGERRQIAMIRAEDAAAARAAAKADPAVRAGLFTIEVEPHEPLYRDPRGG